MDVTQYLLGERIIFKMRYQFLYTQLARIGVIFFFWVTVLPHSSQSLEQFYDPTYGDWPNKLRCIYTLKYD